MVALSVVEASNAKLATLPSGMVAVFVGATSGIGEHTLKAFAQHTENPRIYFIGRSQEAATRIVSECKTINANGEYYFIRSDVSLLKNVDEVCQHILAKETSINLLFQTQGSIRSEKTAEGLPIFYALPFTSRILFALNLLPAIQKATSLRRAVTVFAGGYEGHFNDRAWVDHAMKNPLKARRAHISSMITMANNIMASRAPEVSFLHNYPSMVKTKFGSDAGGLLGVVFKLASTLESILPDRMFLSAPECGARQLYMATSAMFPSATGDAVGVPLPRGASVARGTDGKPGSGSYTVNFDAENVSLDVDKLLAKAKADGAEEALWTHVVNEIQNITGRAR